MELSEEAINYPAVPRPLTDRITELVCNNGSGTDEPPRQPLRTDREGTEIIRPLFGVWEECLTRLSEERAIRPEGSGCGHGATIGTQTPREMVHYRVLRNATPAFRKHLATLASVGLTETGHARMRSRYRRMDDLGPQYKSQLPMSDKL